MIIPPVLREVVFYLAFPIGEYFKTDVLGVLTAPRLKTPWKILSTPEKYEST